MQSIKKIASKYWVLSPLLIYPVLIIVQKIKFDLINCFLALCIFIFLDIKENY
jgi:hypothetical protein